MLQTLAKKIRIQWWLLQGIVKRYQTAIVSSFVVGIILVVLGVRFGPLLYSTLQNETKIIGLVGSYTPTSLPSALQRLVSSGLTDIKINGEASPALATSWDISDDGKEYTFHLQNNLYWHDGKKFTSYDVNYNLKDVEFEPLDETTLKVKLKEPFTPLPNFLSKPLFRKGLLGLGSYKIDSIKLKGETVTFLRLKPLTQELPWLEVKFYPSQVTAKNAFKLGEVNTLDEMETAQPFSDWKAVVVKENMKHNQYVALFFNQNDENLKIKEIRQALNFATPKTEQNRIATPISTTSWAYTSRVKQYDQDMSTAKKLLEGIDTSKIHIRISTFPQYLKLAESIAGSWKTLGIDATVNVVSGLAADYQVLLVTQEIPSDPDQYPLWHSTQNVTNISHYVNLKIDKLLEDGRKEQDRDKRKKIYADFQRYLVDDSPAIFLFHPTSYTISRR